MPSRRCDAVENAVHIHLVSVHLVSDYGKSARHIDDLILARGMNLLLPKYWKPVKTHSRLTAMASII